MPFSVYDGGNAASASRKCASGVADAVVAQDDGKRDVRYVTKRRYDTLAARAQRRAHRHSRVRGAPIVVCPRAA